MSDLAQLEAVSTLEDENARVAAVRQLCVLDTPSEPVFDHLTSLACALFRVPMSLVSIVDEHRQFFKSAAGLSATETPRSISFCAHTIQIDTPLVIPDAQCDPRFQDNPLVTGSPFIRFYAGVPLRDKNGFKLGSFCVLSTSTRHDFSPEDKVLLSRFAALASEALEQRLYSSRLTAAEREIAEINERYRLAARATRDGLWDWNLTTGQVYYSPRLRAMMGCAEEEHWAGIDAWVERLHPEDAAAAKANIVRLTTTPVECFQNEYRMRHEDGTWRWVHNRGTAVRDEEGKLLRLTGAMRDLTLEKTRDSLTDLETRTALVNSIDQRFAAGSKQLALLVADVDNFKRVNDTLGTNCGDLLLLEVAHRLRQTFERAPVGVIARFMGDEFAILLDGVSSSHEAMAWGERLLSVLHLPFSCNGQEVNLCTSVGIALPEHAASAANHVLEDAQFAMHQAKANGGGQCVHFDSLMREEAQRRLTLEGALRSALARNELMLFYQPKVDMGTGDLLGFEALLRWNYQEHGLVSPAQFIPLAEESELILEIGRWTLRTAIKQLSLWRATGLVRPEITIAINLSAKQFADAELIPTVRASLERFAVPAHCVDLEITEGVLIHDAPKALSILNALKAIGVGLDLDDFGTGFSSLSYLQKFPFDTLKIDRSFVMKLCTSQESLAIVQAVIGLGKALDLEIVAEGVETREQSESLLQAGCRTGQGFYFSKPLPVEEIPIAVQGEHPFRRENSKHHSTT